METTSEGKTSAKAISHYAGSGNALTWTSEGSEKWTRDIPGIDGALDAIQTGGGAIVLQLHDLQGNIVGTVGDSESETKLLSTYNSTEFGVPQPGTTPPKYAWLGASGVSTETSLGSGVATQSGASYVPQVARALQTAPVVPPGAFPNGSSGTQFTAAPVTAGAIAGAQEIATQFWQEAEAERQKAREEEAAAALQKCREEGGCGAEEEESACQHAFETTGQEACEGGIDPSLLLTSKQSFVLAAGLRNGGEALEYAVSRIPAVSLLVKVIVTLSHSIATDLANGLEGCYTLINEINANARCKAYINLLGVIPTGWGVETCFAKEHKSGKKVDYTYPYCDKT
jgi:hypothetical protein